MSMARRTRKQLVGKIENEEIALREEQVWTLWRELRRQWRAPLNDR
jgi:hypothetical protein